MLTRATSSSVVYSAPRSDAPFRAQLYKERPREGEHRQPILVAHKGASRGRTGTGARGRARRGRHPVNRARPPIRNANTSRGGCAVRSVARRTSDHCSGALAHPVRLPLPERCSRGDHSLEPQAMPAHARAIPGSAGKHARGGGALSRLVFARIQTSAFRDRFMASVLITSLTRRQAAYRFRGSAISRAFMAAARRR